MTRAKHGNYDEDRGLPDNRGQAQGSGIYVWLQSEVEQRFGKGLVDQAQAHGNERYTWLLAQLAAMGNDGKQLIAEFEEKRRADAAERRQRDRQRAIVILQGQIDAGAAGQRLVWLTQQIEKIQRSYEKAAKTE